MLALNPDSPVPLYAQLAERILRKIRRGEFEVGERIPSEHSLADRYGIGRPTVRQATETLIRRGYLARKRGAGTFVTDGSRHVDLFSLGGTLSSFSRQGIELHTRLIEAPHLVRIEANEEHALRGREVYKLQRLGSVDRKAILLESICFDAEVFPFFDRLQVAGRSLSEAVLSQYGLEASSAEQRFSAVLPCKEEASLLGLSKGEPALKVDRTLHFPSVKNAVFAQMLCRSDELALSQHIGGDF